MTKSTLKWAELNPSTDLSKEAKTAYDGYKAIYKQAKEARDKFEAIVAQEAAKRNVIPDGHRVAFSYNFGRLSVAIAPKEAERKAKAGAGWSGLTA